jgi:uncharacterized protein YdeI (YjbR/CyaY-like superfamily)
MSRDVVESGLEHTLPTDIKDALLANKELLKAWNGLTPLARNEWICWVTIVKKAETRRNHIDRLRKELFDGKRRPCCWAGCPHHNPKALKWFK